MSKRIDGPGIRLPSETRDAILAIGAQLKLETPRVAVGQVWRANWNDDQVLCVILETQRFWAVAAPASVDTGMADPYSVILSESPLQVPLAVFAGLAIQIPLLTLDAHLGAIDEEDLSPARSLYMANLKGSKPDVGLRVQTGSLDTDDLDERRDYRIDLSQTLSRVASAQLNLQTESQGDLKSILVNARVSPSALAVELSIPLPEARQLAAGGRPPTEEEALAIARIADVSVHQIASAASAVPEGLLRAVSSPHTFRLIRAESASTGLSFEDVVRSIPSRFAGRRQKRERVQDSDLNYWEHAVMTVLGKGGSN